MTLIIVMFLFLSIGRLTKQKNFQFLIKAYTLLKKEGAFAIIFIMEREEKN